MEDAAPFNKRALVGAYDRSQDNFESATDKVGDAFVYDIAAKDGPIVP